MKKNQLTILQLHDIFQLHDVFQIFWFLLVSKEIY